MFSNVKGTAVRGCGREVSGRPSSTKSPLAGDLIYLPEITRGILQNCWVGKTRVEAQFHPENPLNVSRHPSDWRFL